MDQAVGYSVGKNDWKKCFGFSGRILIKSDLQTKAISKVDLVSHVKFIIFCFVDLNIPFCTKKFINGAYQHIGYSERTESAASIKLYYNEYS